MAAAGPEGPGARGQPAPGAELHLRQPGRGRPGTAHPVPRRGAVDRQVLARDVPPSGHPRRAAHGRHAHQPRGGGGAVCQPAGRPRRDRRPAAHGQLRAGGRVGDPGGSGHVHHRRRTPAAGVGLRGVRPLPPEPGDGGTPADRRADPVRDPGPAAAQGRPGLPGQRPRPQGVRDRGRAVRREGADRGHRRARGAHRRRAAPDGDLVRGRGRMGSPHLPGGSRPRVGDPRGEDQGHEPADGAPLGNRARRAPAGLAHAAARLHRRPRKPGRPLSPRGVWGKDSLQAGGHRGVLPRGRAQP